MQNRALLYGLLRVPRTYCVYRQQSTLDIKKLEEESSTSALEVDEETKLRELEIERKRNKSRLNANHRNEVNQRLPFNEPKHWSHGTLRYHRKMYGVYGSASGLDPAFCWPTEEELKDQLDYEAVAYPYTIKETAAAARKQREEKQAAIWARQKDIVAKMAKVETWKAEMRAKIAKKEAEALAAKNRKERLIEEVRRHFGYTVDPKDDRFKEMLEKKEKEQKKAMKEERKKLKQEKLLGKLAEARKPEKSDEQQ